MKELSQPIFGFMSFSQKKRVMSWRPTLMHVGYFAYDNFGREIFAKTRKRPIPENRGIIYRIAYQEGLFSYREIGQLASQDHATVLHAINSCKDLCQSDKNYNERYEKMVAKWMLYKMSAQGRVKP